MKKLTYFLLTAMLLTLSSLWCEAFAAAKSLPYSYGFESDFTTEGWTMNNQKANNTSYVGVNSTAAKTGSAGYRMSSYSAAANQYLISPELDATKGVIVRFYYKCSSSYWAETFKIGYSTTNTSPSSFTWGDQISASTTWTQTEELSFPAGTKFVAVNYYASSDKYHFYVDDFTFDAPPSCPKPTDVTKGEVSTTSASFTWTAGGEETSWQWACLPAATTVDWTDGTKVNTVTTAAATVTGLSANTSYKFYVRAYCAADDQSADVSLSFKTACGAIASLPTYGFEDDADNALPDCWSRISDVAYPCVYNYDYYAKSGNKSLYFYKAGPQYAILPVFNQDVKNLTASFWYSNYSYSESLQVGYMSDPEDASTFVYIETLPYITSYNSEATEVSFGSAPTGVRYIAFKYTCSSSWGKSFIDDITVSVASSCAKPTSPLAVAASATSATVSWTAGGSETTWNLQYRVGSGAWSTKSAITSNPYTLTGLSANTTYEIQVQADCDGEQSQWSASANVTTPCEAVTGVGWSFDFEDEVNTGSGNIPDCWKSIGGSYPYTYNSSYYAHESNKCLYFYGGTSSSKQIAVLPAFTEDINTLSVSLWYNHYYSSYTSSSYPQLQIGYITNPADATTFKAVATLDRYATYTHAEDIAITGASDGAYIALCWGGGSSSGYLMVDDIEIKRAPTCFKPASVAINSTTYNSVNFSWTESGHGEEEWQYAVVAANGTPASWTKTSSKSASVDGLTTGSSYQVCVRSYCGASDQSDFIRSASFTPTCQVPSAVTASSVTSNSASISWTANNGESKWNLQYRKGTGAWTTLSNITANPYSLTGLDANSSYTVQVACAEGCTSGYSTTATFNTKCGAIAANELPYENNFESETASKLPSCWDRLESGSYPQVVSGSASYGGSGKCLAFNGSGTQTAILPGFELEVNELTITFYYRHSYCDVQIGYVKSDGTTFVPKATLPTRSAYNTTPYEVDMSSWSDEAAYIALRMTETTSSWANAYIDNVVVKKTPTCFAPATLNDAASITSEGATFTWTASSKANESEYQYICVPSGETPDWSAAENTTARTVTLTGLEGNTAYDFYVRSYCAADDQSESLKKSFTTLCGKISSLPWSYGFEDGTNAQMPGCWEAHYSSGYHAYVYTSNVRTGNKVLDINAPKTEGNETYVVLPKFEAALSGLGISFWYKGTTGASVQVGYMTNASSKATFTAVGSALTASSTYQLATVSLASVSADAYIAIRFKGVSGEASFYVDDIRVARTVTISDNVDNGSQISSLVDAGETTDVLMTRSLIKDGDYNPLCLPFSLSAAQLADADCPLSNFKLKVFDYIQNVNDEIVIYIAGASSIEAGVPYFVSYQGSPTATTTQLLFRDVTFTTDEAGSKTCDNVTYQGTFSPTTLADQTGKTNPEILFLGADNTIYWPNENVNLKGFRAYFTVDYSSLAPGRRIRGLRFAGAEENAATSVDALSSEEGATSKRVENNQVVIIRDGVKYTVLGQPIR